MSNLLTVFIAIVVIVLVLVLVILLFVRSRETFTEGHPQLTFKVLTEKPRITEIGNFMSPEECDHLIKLAEDKQCFQRSGVQSYEAIADNSRTSWSCVLERSEDDVIKRIEDRVASLTSMPPSHIEAFQIVRYQPGQFFKGHYDFYPPGGPGTAAATSASEGGQRLYTFFVYLNDVQGGGHTHFPNVPIRIAPTKGKAAFWSNLHPDGTVDYDTYHAGEPPKNDVKYGLNIWLRQLPN